MASEDSWLKAADRLLGMPGDMARAVVNFFMKDGTISALGREAVKDVQASFHQAAWGHPGQSHEPGGPLTPLYMDIANARDQYTQENATMSLPSPSEIAKESGQSSTVHGQGHEASKGPMPSPSEIAKDQSTVHGRTDGGQDRAQLGPWTQREIEREQNGSGGQNEQFEARILPEEQREQQKEQDRGRGR